jgi:hypothetical protein
MYRLRKLNAYRFIIYSYLLPTIWLISLYFVFAYPGVVGWTGNFWYDLVILSLMFPCIMLLAVIGPKRFQISRIEVVADRLTPPLKPFKAWIMRTPYRQEVARINPFIIGDRPGTEHCLEVVLVNGVRWFFILRADRITGFLGARAEDAKVIISQMETKNRKWIMERFGLNGYWFL